MGNIMECVRCGEVIAPTQAYVELVGMTVNFGAFKALDWVIDDLHFCSLKCFDAWLSDISAQLRARRQMKRG